MIQVQWLRGSEIGFADISTAERFINKIGKVVAPDLNFTINNLIVIPL